VHDGWGYSQVEKGNAIHAGTTTNMDILWKEGDGRHIEAHGLSVGLNDGLMGNSEVGFVLMLLKCSSPPSLSTHGSLTCLDVVLSAGRLHL
jgi:hypothetical protein